MLINIQFYCPFLTRFFPLFEANYAEFTGPLDPITKLSVIIISGQSKDM